MGVEASIDTNNTNVNYHLKGIVPFYLSFPYDVNLPIDLLITDSLESLDNAIMTHLAVITPDNPNDSAISGIIRFLTSIHFNITCIPYDILIL